MAKLFRKRGARLAAASAAVAATALLGGVAAAVYSGVEPTAVSLNFGGSTTVGPLTEAIDPIYEAAATNAGTSLIIPVPWHGSGTSWNSMKITNPLAPPPTTTTNGWIEIGQSSRPGSATDKVFSGTTTPTSHVYDFGRDALIFCVDNNPAMNFLSQNPGPGGVNPNPGGAAGVAAAFLTIDQIKAIYEDGDGAAVPDTKWSDLNPAWPARTIVPRARITNSGSQPDMLRLTGTSSSKEAATITDIGLARGQESRDMAEFCRDNIDHLSYTGLAAVDDLDISGEIIEIPIKDPSNFWPGDNGIGNPSVTTPQAPTPSNVNTLAYPLTRQLYYLVHDSVVWPRNYDLLRAKSETAAMTDAQVRELETKLVKADDFINFVFSCGGSYTFPNTCLPNTGGALIQASELVASELVAEARGPHGIPFPDWDVDLGGTVNVLDVLPIRDNFTKASAVKGWIRADVNNDGTVNVLDVLPIRDHFTQIGFVEPNESNP